ncbi:putative tyrosinase [Tirmania nivea]|nr:putative tyrosinase [Tirmania nivea]
MPASRVRHSIAELQTLYPERFVQLVRAFRGIQKLGPEDPNSFFTIGGYHGEPFLPPPEGQEKDWWGGYCHHTNVLFPLWHRAYLYRLEDALRSIEGCEDVTLPYWDETLFDLPLDHLKNPIPSILTNHKLEVPVDGSYDNPFFSYTLQKAIEGAPGTEQRYTKHKGYSTVRYPLSGLVGTEKDRAATAKHNKVYCNLEKNEEILNGNVANWLRGKVKLPHDCNPSTKYPDTSSVYARYRLCLEAPNYTVFSNNASAKVWREDSASAESLFYALESPHNAIHLAIGGFYQKGKYIASPIEGANGDMGDNETAGFDPIFFFHHCFIDYVFWMWQRKHGLTAPGSLTIDYTYPDGTVTLEGMPCIPAGTKLTMNTPLRPFRKLPNDVYYEGNDLVDIEKQLDYTYAAGSLEPFIYERRPFLTSADRKELVSFRKARGINRTDYPGSFVIRLLTKSTKGEVFDVGYEPVLSRWSVANCANCQSHLDVEAIFPIYKAVEDTKDNDSIYWVEIQTREGYGLLNPVKGGPGPEVVEIPLKEDHKTGE